MHQKRILMGMQETLYIFKAYAGGVHHTYGQHALEQWVRQLVQAGF